MRAFPETRLRRNRRTPWLRAMVRETVLTPANLLWPVFVTAGAEPEPIATMPGVVRHPLAGLGAIAREAASLGIPAIALFPNTPGELRTDDGREALNPDNLVCRAIAELKAATDAVGVMTDVALDPYTAHGHDGLVDAAGRVLNDATVEVLVGQALNQARAGADILAPSDMMDGRIGAIRRALEAEGFPEVHLMAYSAKYASGFYGPFRDAVGAAGRLKGDKATYQMDPANAREALAEVALDLAEGADSVMVKPGLAYLDVVKAVAGRFDAPVFAYCVSGEYAMVEAAVAAGMLAREAVVPEMLLAFRRAGAAGVLTYHAPFAARLLGA
ncbi:MAG: porphobilinogen synthase [Thermaurantiacus tibetensis]|uniref:porphobilinogen synthase n=1 Tax=Thermaurantiacus tibetensis TaxID=2759035 RepID=UPI00188FB504|nr:porphobilinogen synthase [Thermaurantiacus tibetensis]